MPLAPELEAVAEAAKNFPPANTLPVAELRALVRQYAMASPPLDAGLASIVDRTIPGPGGDLPVRIYTPPGAGPFPILIYLHGGGFMLGDLDTQDMICRAFARDAGALVISVDYRLAPEHRFPAGFEDARAAALWAQEHGAELNGDPRLLAIGGDSAGGVLANAVALSARDQGAPRLCAQMNFYGSCNYPSEPTASSVEFDAGPILRQSDIQFFWNAYLSDPDREMHNPYACPYRAESHADLAPAFIASAEVDPSRDDTEKYAAKLAAAGNDVVSRRYDGMLHGFLSWVAWLPTAQSAILEASAWLKQQYDRAR
ncbi:MAG: alpha/beta hydrolase [Hyphomonadaceae bacterium]|nr:alpha/beta hydrolase [Hyphomonadaceae bacterium]